MHNDKRVTLRRADGEQAQALAPRYFGLPLGADDEAAEVMRYYFEHALGHPGGLLPDGVTALELPPVAEMFRIYRQRALADRPTGRWTRQRRSAKPLPKKTPRRL